MTKLLPLFLALGSLASTQAAAQFAATPGAWTLPAGGYQNSTASTGFYSFNSVSSAAYSNTVGCQTWQTMDLNGDGKLDLVVPSEVATANYPPTAYASSTNRAWKVFLGNGTSFATSPIAWTLPAGGYQNSMNNTGAYSYNNVSSSSYSTTVGCQVWQLLDMNGDGKPDLVVPGEVVAAAVPPMAYATTTGRAWRVYLNTGTGFATTPSVWALPAGGYLSGANNYSFNGVSSTSYSTTVGCQTWQTMDMNADGRPDLVVPSEVVTANYAPAAYTTTTGRAWKVYLNTGTGFATTPSVWALPAGGYQYGTNNYSFNSVSAASYSTTVGCQTWQTMDLNADGKLDLVVPSEVATANYPPVAYTTSAGRVWRVFLGNNAGFATTPVTWTLPAGGYQYGTASTGVYSFNSVSSAGYSSTVGCQVWQTMDLNADGKLDLVVPGEVSVANYPPVAYATSTSRIWKVFPGTGTGFATTPVAWTLPSGGYQSNTTSANFHSFNSVSSPGFSTMVGCQTWQTMDINADGKLDLVVPSEVSTTGLDPVAYSAGTGRYWRVYLNAASTVTATAASASLVDGVQLYPNPASDQLTLSGPVSLAGQSYAVLDALGRTVRTGQLGAAQPTLDVQALPAGVYGVRLADSPRLLRFVKH